MEISGNSDKAPALRQLPSRLLGQTAALVGKVTAEALALRGAHRHQFAVLTTLDAFGASSQADLCRRTDIDRSDMNAVVTTLEAEGALSRLVDPGSRRRNIVALTEVGRVRHAELAAVVRDAQARALAPLTARQRSELIRLLQMVHDHLAGP